MTTPRPRRRHLALVVALALTTAACGDGSDSSGPPSSDTQVPSTDNGDSPRTTGDTEPTSTPVEVVATTVLTVDDPIAMVRRPDDDLIWLAERSGLVHTVEAKDDGTLAVAGDPVLDISDRTEASGEQGLLGMVFSADGSELYVSYTNLEGDTRLVAYDVGPPPAHDGPLDPDAGTVLFELDQPYPNHNGGHVILGPDGLLWFGLGDGGAGDDPDNRAQNPDDLHGKILRFDPSEANDDGTVTPEVVVDGVRNPWRFAFDEDDSLWIADVGQNEIEEIDRLPADQIDGANLGWSGYEGSKPYLDGEGRRPDDAVMPVFEYTHADNNCSITGGFVYRGTAIDGLQGAYLFADFCVGRLRAVRLDATGGLAAEYDLGIDVAGPVSFAADADGEPYVLASDGSVARIEPAS